MMATSMIYECVVSTATAAAAAAAILRDNGKYYVDEIDDDELSAVRPKV